MKLMIPSTIQTTKESGMVPSKDLFSLLFSLLFLAMLLKKVESQHTSFLIDTFTPDSQLLAYERDAFVPPDTGFARLTAVNGSGWPLRESAGRVLYRAPVTLWARGTQASFTTTVIIRVGNAGPLNTRTLGQGITFFMVPVNSTRPLYGSGENLGIYEAVSLGIPVFAVEFNHGRDNSLSHIGININSRVSRNTTVRGIGMTRQALTAVITYDSTTKTINVNAWFGFQSASVSFVFDLATIFPQQVQFGLSGSTGTTKIGYLDVYHWHFNSLMVHNNADIKPYEM